MVGGTYTKMDGTANTRSECLDKCLLHGEYNSVTYGMQNKKCYCDKLMESAYGLTYTSNSKYTSCYMTKLKNGMYKSFLFFGTLNGILQKRSA